MDVDIRALTKLPLVPLKIIFKMLPVNHLGVLGELHEKFAAAISKKAIVKCNDCKNFVLKTEANSDICGKDNGTTCAEVFTCACCVEEDNFYFIFGK